MDRFRNYGLWVALFSLIGLFVNDLIAPARYQEIVDAILAVLVAGGIVNNPSLGRGYKDNLEL
ncbi:holin [Bacillus carboniphilus]|uniref:Holin n=1 Tax=Bacillus carboniphilus TaxID=86663 RepID=A0ABY9JQJ6_9BACI|nr:holin [Bacillus carboniphilus]WLR41665.1 holin [Bacillus carboniphilus]